MESLYLDGFLEGEAKEILSATIFVIVYELRTSSPSSYFLVWICLLKHDTIFKIVFFS
jgi:hypothetical protein